MHTPLHWFLGSHMQTSTPSCVFCQLSINRSLVVITSSTMNFWKRAMDRRGRSVVPSTQPTDKEPEATPSEENDEDESLLYSHGGRSQERSKSLSRKIWTAVLVVGSMVCCFGAGFMVRDLTVPLVWNFDNYETRKHQPRRHLDLVQLTVVFSQSPPISRTSCSRTVMPARPSRKTRKRPPRAAKRRPLRYGTRPPAPNPTSTGTTTS